MIKLSDAEKVKIQFAAQKDGNTIAAVAIDETEKAMQRKYKFAISAYRMLLKNKIDELTEQLFSSDKAEPVRPTPVAKPKNTNNIINVNGIDYEIPNLHGNLDCIIIAGRHYCLDGEGIVERNLIYGDF